MRLSDLGLGASAEIERMDLGGSIRARLRDMGFVPGMRVECVLKAMSGDPTAYRLRGRVVAVRRCDADDIQIRAAEGEGV